MKNMDQYTVCLLAWFYGMEPEEVTRRNWTQSQIEEAQAYCETKHEDPVHYCGW